MKRSVSASRFAALLGVLLLLFAWVAAGPALAASPPTTPSLIDRVTALEKAMTLLQGQVGTLQTQVSTLSAKVDAQGATISLQAQQIAALQAGDVLSPFVSIVPGAVNGLKGPHIFFSGANVHIVSGSGWTNDNGTLTGLGNLIVGYNEAAYGASSGYRMGSHNLIVGPEHTYTSFGGFVAGQSNSVTGRYASVGGGYGNAASGDGASVAGGSLNVASASDASVLGGSENDAGGPGATISGGKDNTANGSCSSVSGGSDNAAAGQEASITGGHENSTGVGYAATVAGGWKNMADGPLTTVSGGAYNTAYCAPGADAQSTSVFGGYGNIASGFVSTALGGAGNTASGNYAVVSGGQSNQALGDFSSVSGGGSNIASVTGASVSGGSGLSLDVLWGWAAGVPGSPAAAPVQSDWFLAPSAP
jgi:hypothetical protein